MTLDSLLVFVTILFVAAIIPGPGIISLISKTLGGGKLTGFYFLFGLILGDVIFVILAFFGMAALAHSMGDLFQLIKWIGAGFLAYMAYKILTSKNSMFEVQEATKKKSPMVDVVTGILVTLGNPKPLIFYAAIMPQVIDLTKVSIGQLGIVVMIVFATLIVVGGAYIWVSNQITRLAKNEKVQKRLNRGSGGVLLGTAIWVAFQN